MAGKLSADLDARLNAHVARLGGTPAAPDSELGALLDRYEQEGQKAQQPEAKPDAPSATGSDYRTTTATTPAEAKREHIAGELEKMHNDQLSEAVGFGAARGLAPGVDRWVGLGTQIGEQAAAALPLFGGKTAPADPQAGAKAREDYLQAEDEAREAHPLTFTASEVGAPILATGAAGLGARVVGLKGATAVAEGLPMSSAPVATSASPTAQAVRSTLGRASEIAASPAGKVGAFNAASGALNSRSDDPIEAAKEGATAAAVGGIAQKAADKTIGRLFKGAGEREYRGLLRDMMVNADTDIAATSTTRRRFLLNSRAALDEVRADKVLREVVQDGDAEAARNIARSKLQEITGPRAGMYQKLDSHGTIKVSWMLKELGDAVKHNTDNEADALREMQKRLIDDWIPKWQAEGNLITDSKGRPLAVRGAGVRQWVSKAQKAAATTIGQIEEGARKQVKTVLEDTAENLWDAHLDAVAKREPALVKDIRTYDRRASGLLAIDRVMEQRLEKDMQGVLGFAKKHEKTIDKVAAAGTLAAAGAGHAGEAALAFGAYQGLKKAGSAARWANDRLIAPLQRAAEAGTPWAVLSRDAANLGVSQSVARTIFDRVQASRTPTDEGDE